MDKYISWGEYLDVVNSIATEINYQKTQTFKINWNLIYGIPRGGLIPATILSYKLNIPLLLAPINSLKYDECLLIVDDVLDSGQTMIKTIQTFVSHGISKSRIWIVTLYRKQSGHEFITIKQPVYLQQIPSNTPIIDNNVWIHFPYEQNSFATDTLSVVKQPGT